ncbi:MAG TPA: hypothetical protein DCL15_01400 [Chloroflexi bacterium]|nr:hypothetical protein [Chloroflexota bacterium]HHW85909.1 hypothetical protein [Chloroflexota bacterium]
MAKTFYTERDIEDLHARGITSIDIHDDVVLTDLARERALKLGMRLERIKPNAHPADAPNEALIHRIKAAVLAQLGGRWIDPNVLDAVVRRVVAEMER